MGFIWVQIKGDHAHDLGGLESELEALDLKNFDIHAAESRIWDCNWKIIVEGGLEAYHFRVAHAKTIGALFHDNLSTYQCFGPHIRSILARTSIDDLVSIPRDQWQLRDHANILYNLFPNTALLVQFDHVVVWLTLHL